jgi:hypothetical protein
VFFGVVMMQTTALVTYRIPKHTNAPCIPSFNAEAGAGTSIGVLLYQFDVNTAHVMLSAAKHLG